MLVGLSSAPGARPAPADMAHVVCKVPPDSAGARVSSPKAKLCGGRRSEVSCTNIDFGLARGSVLALLKKKKRVCMLLSLFYII